VSACVLAFGLLADGFDILACFLQLDRSDFMLELFYSAMNFCLVLWVNLGNEFVFEGKYLYAMLHCLEPR
jgi:hypothetical protein